MKVKPKKVTIRELVDGFSDSGEGGVQAYHGKLDLRPPYQREFVYKEKERNAVISSVKQGLPLNTMYWNKRPDSDTYECLDGQQRSLAICKYIGPEDFSVDNLYWHSLSKEAKNKILDYELLVYECEGTDDEKLNWFKTVNMRNNVLRPQELRNAFYTGPWLTAAKKIFSRRGQGAAVIANGFVSGDPTRQELLDKALQWITDLTGQTIEEYMSEHQFDEDAEELWLYFRNVLEWADTYFPKSRDIKKSVEWNVLYEENKGRTDLDPTELEKQISEYLKDGEIKRKAGIYEYVLNGNETALDLRTFDDKTKTEIYEKQKHQCPMCKAEGKHIIYDISEMEADHVIPWSKGGRTVKENCQLLCKHHNRTKSNS